MSIVDVCLYADGFVSGVELQLSKHGLYGLSNGYHIGFLTGEFEENFSLIFVSNLADVRYSWAKDVGKVHAQFMG
jgi:hypothetical protein